MVRLGELASLGVGTKRDALGMKRRGSGMKDGDGQAAQATAAISGREDGGFSASFPGIEPPTFPIPRLLHADPQESAR